jgi:putative mRNA 3-end processing factor
MPVEWSKGGLVMQGTPLWLDARLKTPLGFVSHAHSDHIARHEHVIATPETLRLMEHRLGPLLRVTPAPYGRRLRIEDLELELLPAGHVLGSAQVRITRGDGHRVVYTGDLSLDAALTAAPAEIAPCDTLILESTFGHPKYHFPPRAEAYDAVAAWARAQLERGRRPVLLAYSLGKSQEAIAQLTARGLSLCAHPSIHDVLQLYASLGVDLEARRFDGQFLEGEVGIFPPFGWAKKMPRGSPERGPLPWATAVLTGWALEQWGARRSGADIAFPVSDHADFPSLLRYATQSGAREIITVHGFAEELAKGLRQAGLFARAITERVQLELGL